MVDPEHKRLCYLMAVYNDPQGMMRTLRSLEAEGPLVDIVIVDDGSEPALIAPPGVTMLRLAANAGIAQALNHGLRFILDKPYDYVARIDAGDRVVPGRSAAQAAYLDHHPAVGVVGAQMRGIDAQSGAPVYDFINPIDPQKFLPLRNTLAHPSAMIRIEALRTCGLYDPQYLYAEDYELWCRVARRYGIANLPQIWVEKEITPNQITARKRHATRWARFKVQLKYFEVARLYCWLGVMRSLSSFFVPLSLWAAFKKRGRMLVLNPVKR